MPSRSPFKVKHPILFHPDELNSYVGLMMSEQEIYARVCRVIADTLEIGEIELSESTRVKEDLGADSMQVVTIIIALDHEFDTEFNMAELPNEPITLKWIADFVERTIARKQ